MALERAFMAALSIPNVIPFGSLASAAIVQPQEHFSVNTTLD
jgi:hypothetical protein